MGRETQQVVARCEPRLAAVLADGRIRWRCARCGRGGVTPHELARVRPGACRGRIALDGPAREGTCAGCARRRAALDRFWPGAGELAARVARPIARWVGRARRRQVLLRFGHGFGDAVQLTVVLKHLRRLRPEWDVDLVVKPGWGSLFAGLARSVFETERVHGDVRSPAQVAGVAGAGEYDLDRWLDFPEPETCYADSPSTKAERCLREALAIEPIEELCGYSTPFGPRELALAEAYYSSLPANQGVVLVHYQGRTVQHAKNLDERVVAEVCRRVRARGCVPVVLDFERPVRSRLVDQRTIFCPKLEAPVWAGRGHGDAATIAALAHRARLCVAIDSGPGHVFAGEQVGTPTLIAWRAGPLHPLHYFPPAAHVTHLVPADHWRALRGDVAAGRRYFRERYRSIVCEAHLRRTLPELVSEFLEGGAVDARLARRAICRGRLRRPRHATRGPRHAGGCV